VAQDMPETDEFDLPPYKVARFYVRTPEGLRGISLPADMLEDPQNVFTQAFLTANKIMQEADRIKERKAPSWVAQSKPKS